MLDILRRTLQHLVTMVLNLPLTLWTNYQWRQLKYRETGHLLRLDDYLLADMGFRRVDGRIEAIDPSRIDPERMIWSGNRSRHRRNPGYRHAN